MSAIDKFYSVFESEKLNKALEKAFDNKPDMTWIALMMTLVSTGFVLIKNFREIVEKNANQIELTTSLLVFTLLIGALFLLTVMYSAYSINRYRKTWKYTLEDLRNEVFSAEIEHELTYVFLIKKNIDNSPKLLFLERDQWGYMLPYWRPRKSADKKDIEKHLSNYFPGIHLKVKIHDRLSLKNIIKKKPEEGYSKISYIFCHVTLYSSYNNFTQLLKTDTSLKTHTFKTLDELRDDLSTMKSNSDIVSHLTEENIFGSEESFIENKNHNLPHSINKVIWNITDQCSFDCHFCATKRNTDRDKELSFENRLYIAEQLLQFEGINIDFAGGDPLHDPEARKSILHVSKYMMREGVTITSTGIGLSATSDEQLHSISKSYDISYDFPSHWSEDDKHRGDKYNKLNYDQIKRMRNNGFHVNILTTLSEYNMGQGIINQMINELKQVNPDSITLLRLMPVGKQSYDSYPDKDSYNPSHCINMFMDEFGDKIKLHCAFRVYDKERTDYVCGALNTKFGLDNLGNLYGCAWAGYLPIKNEENPFYIGNILEGGVERLFNSKEFGKFLECNNKSNNKFCKIFSYLENPSVGLFENKDKYISEYQIYNK